MSEVKVKIKIIDGCADLVPEKQHENDVGFDLKSRVDVKLYRNEVKLVPTGIKIEFPANYEAQIRPRSGLALKKGITIQNTPGTIDPNYRGEVGVLLNWNGVAIMDERDFIEIKRGDRIAQMVIKEVPKVIVEIVDELSDTDRGEGGFGSSDKKE